MKKIIFTLAIIVTAVGMIAKDNGKTLNEKGDIIKKGWNYGP